MIYIPGHTRTPESTAWRLMVEEPFALLISVGDGEPYLTPMPVVVDAEQRLLKGHLARANPHSQFVDGNTPMTVVFQGPHAYISPEWYESPEVPTWNYLLAEVRGVPVESDREGSMAIVRELVRLYEAPGGINRAPDAEHERILPGIVAFTLPIERLMVKAKVSRNKPMASREGVIRGLRERGDPEDLALARWMEDWSLSD